ncbi:hypothetical protein PHMEG_00019026 [Phytophthora megakarya]|uniref:Core-binding (CB) domain-containing protein n=1 Tax=Phytophthora megakarya TaxID=4795 RepID=A0A225VSK4_9STRA|nr:hypothetical protein PHMEG_00019026 [Phytophthora megakarya]
MTTHDRHPDVPARSQPTVTSSTTPIPGSLNADQVRGPCTSSNTKKAYRSDINGICAWIREIQEQFTSFFEVDGSINKSVFTPAHFEAFLLRKMNSGAIKVSTFSGYRSFVFQ